MRILAALGLTTLLELPSPATEAAALPLVISKTVDYTHNTPEAYLQHLQEGDRS